MHRFILSAPKSRARSLTQASSSRDGLRLPLCRRQFSQQSITQSIRRVNDPNGGTAKSNDANQGTPLPDLEELGAPPQNFARPTLSSIDFWFRFFKFSAAGLVIVSGGTALIFEGAHQYVEHFSLAPERDASGELARWGWDIEAERWTGGTRGGTDPALGFKGAHSLRSAWIAQHWGTGTSVLSPASVERASGQTPIIEASLEVAHDFLGLTLALALERQREGKNLRPETISELLTRHAAVLERIGSKGSLYDARVEYERIWDMGVQEQDAARLALKLGDVSARLGDTEEAREWWGRSLELISGSGAEQASQSRHAATKLSLPSQLPKDPHAQRVLAAILSSLSAHYAQKGLLEDSKAVQEAGIKLLSGNAPGEHSESQKISAPQALHSLYLAHRSSLLALHHAEVNHALRTTDTYETLSELANAATASERIVSQLSSDFSRSDPKFEVDKKFINSKTLEGPSTSLLRDARRTAMHAWTLSGVLHEKSASVLVPASSSSTKRPMWRKLSSTSSSSTPSAENQQQSAKEYRYALDCYERALLWAGANAKSLSNGTGESSEPVDGVLAAEWQTLWSGYNRTREAILKQATTATSENIEKK